MKHILPRLVVSIYLVFLLAACNPSKIGTATPDNHLVATMVAQTLTALARPAQQTPFTSPTSPTMAQSTNTRLPTGTRGPTNTQAPTLLPTGTMRPTDTQAPTLIPTGTIRPTNTPIPPPGIIAGAISGYPYGSVPGLAIVAFGQEPPYYYSWLITVAGQIHFTMSSDYLIPGHFQVVAYDSSGRTGGCSVIVLVISKQTVTCDITNWSAGYPAKPSDVPNP
jgi:hypothetical protein